VVVALTAPLASGTPAYGCGRITVKRHRYSVRAHVLSCYAARVWSGKYLSNGYVPHGYRCHRYNPRITRVRFLCYAPSTATRRDGPESYSASA
jgi:hypothetical protein